MWVPIPADVKKDLERRKEVLEDVSNYKEISELLNKELSGFEKKINQKMSPVEMKNIRVQLTSLVSSLENHTYRCKNRVVYDVYSRVKNWLNLYQSLIKKATSIKNKVV